MNSDRININKINIENIRNQIKKKNSYTPYFVTEKDVTSVKTDFDNFPYNRWWRGIAGITNPVVIEREAGYRIRQDKCYEKNKGKGVLGNDDLADTYLMNIYYIYKNNLFVVLLLYLYPI